MISTVPQIIKQVRYIYTAVDENSNKVWIAKLLDNGDLTVEWGRVGKRLQSKTHNCGSVGSARTKMLSLIADKKRKGYEELQTVEQGEQVSISQPALDLKVIAKSEIKHSCNYTAELIDYLVRVNAHQITSSSQITYNSSTGNFSTVFGVLLPGAIAQARALLNQLASNRFTSPIYDQGYARVQALNEYLKLVPQDLGMKIDKSIFSTPEEIKKQTTLLEALEAAIIPASGINTPTRGDKTFDCSLTLVDRLELERLTRLYERTLNRSHGCSRLRVKKAYQVEIPSMSAAFEQEAKNLGNIQQLWHGTKASNLLSILKSGLVIVPSSAAQVSGRLFGDGVYASEQSTKALNYATNYWNSYTSCDRFFMFLVDFACGKTYNPRSTHENLPKPGYDSTWVKAGTCGVCNHEAIVYRTSQVKLKYLVEFG